METRIRWWLISIAVVALLAVGVYIGWFAGHLGLRLSHDPGSWGQFGDYLGGFLNPLIAAAAFYWLTQSVRIQHTELTATREALRETAVSQAEMASAQAQQVRTLRLTALMTAAVAALQAAEADLLAARQRFQLLARAYQNDTPFMDHDLQPFRPRQAPERLDEIQRKFAEAEAARDARLSEVERLRGEV